MMKKGIFTLITILLFFTLMQCSEEEPIAGPIPTPDEEADGQTDEEADGQPDEEDGEQTDGESVNTAYRIDLNDIANTTVPANTLLNTNVNINVIKQWGSYTRKIEVKNDDRTTNDSVIVESSTSEGTRNDSFKITFPTDNGTLTLDIVTEAINITVPYEHTTLNIDGTSGNLIITKVHMAPSVDLRITTEDTFNVTEGIVILHKKTTEGITDIADTSNAPSQVDLSFNPEITITNDGSGLLTVAKNETVNIDEVKEVTLTERLTGNPIDPVKALIVEFSKKTEENVEVIKIILANSYTNADSSEIVSPNTKIEITTYRGYLFVEVYTYHDSELFSKITLNAAEEKVEAYYPQDEE